MNIIRVGLPLRFHFSPSQQPYDSEDSSFFFHVAQKMRVSMFHIFVVFVGVYVGLSLFEASRSNSYTTTRNLIRSASNNIASIEPAEIDFIFTSFVCINGNDLSFNRSREYTTYRLLIHIHNTHKYAQRHTILLSMRQCKQY